MTSTTLVHILALSVFPFSTPVAAAPPKENSCTQITEKRSGGLARKERATRRNQDPKRVRYVAPKFPREWPKSCMGAGTGAGVTAHEALIGGSGKVEKVWTLKSPCAEIDKVVVAAIRQWEYEPLLVDGKAVSYCSTVTINVHFQ